jgi:hypothetical protein
MIEFYANKQPRFVLVVGDDGVLLVPVQSAELDVEIFAATHDDVSKKAIQKRLAQNPKAPLTILANGAAQEFRVETLPPLNFLDRGKLTQRRLRQAFPQAYAASGRSLDRTHTLLAGLHQGGEVAGWLGSSGLRAVELGLLPVESAGLIAHLVPEAKKGWAILLANFRTGGLRQIVTCDGRVVFTRQTPSLSAEAQEGVTEELLRVIEDSRRYLSRFGLTERADLRIVLLLGRAPLAALRHHADAGHMTLLSPQQAAETLGLDILPDAQCGDSDLVFAGWAGARRKLWLPLMPTAMKRQQQSVALARNGWRVALALLVLALGVAGGSVRPLVSQLYKNHRGAADVANLRAQLVVQEAALAPAAQPMGRLRAALERQRIFAEPQPGPWDVVQRLRQALDGHARAMSVDWRDDGTLRLDLRLESGSEGRVADREAIVANFKALAEQLARQMPDYAVEITRYPFPALPQEALTNLGNEASAVSEAPTAGLTIRRRS